MKSVSLKYLVNLSGKIRIRLDKEYLKKLLTKASNNNCPQSDMEFVRKIGLKPTTKYLNTTIVGWIKRGGSLGADKLEKIREMAGIDWEELQKKVVSVKFGYSAREARISFPIRVNRELGSIIGHILGDGSIDSKYRQISFSNSEKVLLKEFSDNMQKIFCLEPRMWMQENPDFGNTQWDKRIENIDDLLVGRNCSLFYPTVCGVLLNLLFDDFAVGKEKRITNNLLLADREFKIGLIRAFYDDEGSVGDNNIRLYQDRKEILGIFKKLLEEFGITSSGIKTYYKRERERYYFDIFRKSNLKKFEKEIGLTSPKKIIKLRAILNKRPHWNDK